VRTSTSGLRPNDMLRFKRKSEMKKVFERAGSLRRAAESAGTPRPRVHSQPRSAIVVAKPDVGVGAAQTFKIHDTGELESF